MNIQRQRIGALLSLNILAMLAGCGEHRSVLAPNLSPSGDSPALTVSAVRLASISPTLSRYRVSWRASGSVDHFVYTRDPGAADQADARWVSTRETSILVDAPAAANDMVPTRATAATPATVLVRAVDRSGKFSPLGGISIINDNVAPQVQITRPVPSDRSRTYLPTQFEVDWQGIDPDGVVQNLPALYKWTLITQNSEVPYSIALAVPDSVRRYWEPRGYAGWDSTGGFDYNAPAAKYANLIPASDYMFVVVARDEQGAWNQFFSLQTNMLNFRVLPAGQGGPLLTMFNSFFFYQYPIATYIVAPQYQVPITFSSGIPVTVNWIGQPNVSASIQAYRWALDIADVTDNTPRINEQTDLAHWSAPGASTMAATVGPFGGNETHVLYIEATDSNGFKSLGMVRMQTIDKVQNRELLVVDDTRLFVDQKSPSSPCMDAPKGRWPTAAELDSFLFARGGFPWRCYPPGTMSAPGLFAGYAFDTIGTRALRTGIVPLATLGQYRHVIWLTDGLGATSASPPTDPSTPTTSLRYMSAPGHENTLAEYVAGGGNLWVAGGGAMYASMIAYNKLNNDVIPPAAGTTFSFGNGELVPGRFPYDESGWRSEIKMATATATVSRNLGRFAGTGSAYDLLPAGMRVHSAALGDAFPPGRTVSAPNFYYTNFAIEYMSVANAVVDDVDPSPFIVDLQSTLDTLYAAAGAALMPPAFNPLDACMTLYHPLGMNPVVSSGFSLWEFSRVDCQALVDFVLQQHWGLSHTAPAMAKGPVLHAWQPPREAAASAPAGPRAGAAQGAVRRN